MKTTTINGYDMSISGAVVGGAKMLGFSSIVSVVGAVLAAIVVMCLRTPTTVKEFAVCLISTVISSICGGAWVIQHYGLQHWAFDSIGLMSMLGLVFVCGLPGWFFVIWLFNYFKKHRNDDIVGVSKDIKDKFL